MNLKRILVTLLIITLFSCKTEKEPEATEKSGMYRGTITYGNFADEILFEIEKDTSQYSVYFTSLAQNANRIPFQGVEVREDSIYFRLQSDFYTYSFGNKWIEKNNRLQGTLSVDTVSVSYILEKDESGNKQEPQKEDIRFESNALTLNGTIWYPEQEVEKAIVILSSSGNADRSASRAEAILLARKGFTVFHYDKRGTGNSEGDWQGATMEELVSDDINAINYFSTHSDIPLENIGIKGSSQGAAKVPYVLSVLDRLAYGVVVSCPGVSLLESDLNYWKNRNASSLGEDLVAAMTLERKVFEFIAGELSKEELEKAIAQASPEPWFKQVWIPELDEVQTDAKLRYSPIPYFEKTKQPVLILQGTRDEIIPPNSHKLIGNALDKAGNNQYKTVLLKGANHSVYQTGESDFPYWSKLHPDYLKTIEEWTNTISQK